MAMNKVLVTLRSSCGRVGQGLLGTGKRLVWDEEPASGWKVENAVLARVNSETFEVVEVMTLSAADWAEFEGCNAEFSFVHNVEAVGQTLASAMEHVPAAIEEAQREVRTRLPASAGFNVEVGLQVRAVKGKQAPGAVTMRGHGDSDFTKWGVVAAKCGDDRWRLTFESGDLIVAESELRDGDRFEVRECPLPSAPVEPHFKLEADSTLFLNTEDWPLMVLGSDSAEADGSTLIAKIALPSGSVGDDERASKAMNLGRHMIACMLACRGLETLELEQVKPGEIKIATQGLVALRKERDALRDSLSWITQFCQEHREWFGKGTPSDGAEFEWLDNAVKLVSATGRA